MCRLRLFTYPQRWAPLRALLDYEADINGLGIDCLFNESCQYPDFVGFNRRTWTADAPIFQHLLRSCPMADDPEQADAFLVPYLFGTGSTCHWGLHNGGGFSNRARVSHLRGNASKMLRAVLRNIDDARASRHIVLWTVDVEFVGVDARRTLVVHLGDDHSWLSAHLKPLANHSFERGLTVPYRVSHWTPLGFPPPPRPPQSRWLLFANVNLKRHATRGTLDNAIAREAAALNLSDRVYLAATMMPAMEAARHALDAAFCLCPTGDSKGFTGRFYFSLLHGCLPVRFDGWNRNLSMAETAFPFDRRIDWSRIVLNVRKNESAGLLRRLAEMPEDELRSRQRYLQKVAPMLHYHNPVTGYSRNDHADASAGRAPDARGAAALLVEQLEERLLGGGVGRPARRRSRSAGSVWAPGWFMKG